MSSISQFCSNVPKRFCYITSEHASSQIGYNIIILNPPLQTYAKLLSIMFAYVDRRQRNKGKEWETFCRCFDGKSSFRDLYIAVKVPDEEAKRRQHPNTFSLSPYHEN